jgi:hypothetical protein
MCLLAESCPISPSLAESLNPGLADVFQESLSYPSGSLEGPHFKKPMNIRNCVWGEAGLPGSRGGACTCEEQARPFWRVLKC